MMQNWKTFVGLGVALLGWSVHAQSFTNGLVVYLRFDNNLNAGWITTNHGSVFSGTPSYVSGPFGQAVRFVNNGNSSTTPSDWAVSLGDLEWLYAGSFSLSAWVRTSSSLNAAVLGNKDWSNDGAIGWALTTRNGREFSWRGVSGGLQKLDLDPPMRNGDWHLVTAVFDRQADKMTVYVDGDKKKDKDYHFNAAHPLTPVPSFNTLVGASGPGRRAGQADIDDLGMWARALTSAEVELVYTYGMDGTNLALNLPLPPVITQDPIDSTAEIGQTATFTGAATGDSVQYKWLFNGIELPSVTLPTLVLNNVQLSQAGAYRLVAFNMGGSVTSAPAVLTVVDLTPPILSCAADKTVECGTAWDFDLPAANDNSGSANVTITVVSTGTNATGCGGTRVVERSWQAEDASGNLSSVCSQRVTLIDATPPALSCAGDKTVECGSDWEFDLPAANDACSGPVTPTVLSTVTNANCGASFTATRTWEAADPCGNSSTCSQTVSVVDTTPPTLTCAADKTVECGQPWDFDRPFADDECVFNALVYDNSANDLATRFNPGTTEVGDEIILEGTGRFVQEFVFEYWGVNSSQTEFAGNVQARVRFYANDGPAFNGFGTPETVLYDSGPFAVQATPRSTLIIDDFVTDAAEPLTGPVPDSFTWTVEFTGLGAGDTAGVDLFSPAVIGNNFLDYWERTTGGWMLKTNPAVSMDFAALLMAAEEDVSVTVLNTITNAGCGDTLTATRTWLATDLCGQTSTCSQKVTVEDTTPPVITCVADKTVECGQPWHFDPPSATDQCIFDTLVFDNATNDLMLRFNPGPLEVGDEIILDGTARFPRQFVFEYWGTNATGPDFAGNVQARVRFYANDGPEFNGYPTPQTVLYDSGDFPVDATPRATLIIEDFKLDAVVPLNAPLPDSLTWSVQFTGLGAGDGAGLDLFSPPVLGADYPDYWERSQTGWSLKEESGEFIDFAALLIATEENVAIGILHTVTNAFPGGTLEATRTWVATDPCGNTATCSQTVTVEDTVPPLITCPPDVTLNCDASLPPPDAGSVVAVDVCDAAPVVQHVDDVETGVNPRVVTRTYQAADASGNSSQCQQVFTFQNVASLPPVILVQPASLTVNAGASASFSVSAASCEAPTYQWFFNGSPIPGANSATYAIGAVTMGDAGDYHVVVANTAGPVTSQTATLTVNRPPVAVPDTDTVPTGSASTLLVADLLNNDFDPDLDPITMVSVSSPTSQGGVAVLLGPQVSYTPPPFFVGADQFFYTIKDGRGGFSTTDVTLSVVPTSDPGPDELQIFRTVNGGYLLRIRGGTAGDYEVQRTPILADPGPSPWQVLGTVTVSNAGDVVEFVDANPLPHMAFYRFRKL